MQTLESREGDFYKRAESWFYRSLEMDPVKATEMGEHRWDGRLGDHFPDALDSQHKERLAALAEFQAIDTSEFGVDALIDHKLIAQILKSEIRKHSSTRPHQRDPGYYLRHALDGVYSLIIKEFAPLEERLAAVVERTGEIERVLREGRENVLAEEVPPVWCEMACEQAEQALYLFEDLLPSMSAETAPSLRTDLRRICLKAAREIGAYSKFMKNAVAPKAAGDFAIGRALFEEILREDHMLDSRADEVLQIGWEVFHETRKELGVLAHAINPERSVQELIGESNSDHPTADGLLRAHREAIDAARHHVLTHRIATIPEGERLRVVETPVHMRTVVPFAAYMPPGILESSQEGLYWVTPIDPDEPADVIEDGLGMHNRGMLAAMAVHEGYPGHHLQLLWSNQSPSVPRKMGLEVSTSFLEGWAFYCEELMEQTGFISTPAQKLIRLRNQLWRAARAVLDVSLHTQGMSVEKGVDFLAEACGMGRRNALVEVRRYTQSPTQPQSYLMGKLALLDLIKEHRETNPEITMGSLHDTILKCGSIPPALMRRKLLHTSSSAK